MQAASSRGSQMAKLGRHPFCEEFSRVYKHAYDDLNDVECGKAVVKM